MPESWMLARLNRETRPYHHIADADRLAMLGAAANKAHYASFLGRVYGFELPLESSLLTTDGLTQWLDLRDRGHLRLLRADLQSLGITEPSSLPRCSTIPSFSQPADALGWIYAVERNTLLHGVIERHLRSRMADTLKIAGSYLAGQQRSNGTRIRDLGAAMDRMAKEPTSGDRIVAAAKAAFRMQHHWYDIAVPPRMRAA